MSECEINPCVKQEYESELQPQPIPSQQFIQEYDSLDDIKNPLPYTIYVVGDSKYYYENGEFIELCMDVPLYTGSTSFTIVDSGLTIATNGKRLNSDITVDISDLETLADEISEVVG